MSLQSPSIVLTRDQVGNARLEALLNIPKEQFVSFDLFDATFQLDALPAIESPIIITSRYAAQYCITLDIPTNSAFYVVGKEVAHIITEYQLGKLAYVAENVDELLHILQQQAKHQHLTYLRGQYISQDIKTILSPANIHIDEHIVYQLHAVDKAAEQLQAFIGDAQSPILLPLLSKRTAAVISELVFEVQPRAAIYAVALSESVMQSVKTYAWAGQFIAKKATMDSLASACMNGCNSISHLAP